MNNSALKVTLVDGALSIVNASNKEHIIFEACMSAYEMFYRYWQIAVQSTMVDDRPADDFVTSWCFNDVFRNNMVKAMASLGLEDVTQFTPRQLEALLISYQGGFGLLFQLHGQVPKMMRAPVTQPKPAPGIWTNLIQRALCFGKSLVIQTSSILGRSGVLSVF
jgi:hypothetical protein